MAHARFAPLPWLAPGFALLLVCEPAHVASAGNLEGAGEPGVEAFAPAGTPAQYAPDRTLDLEHADIAVFPDLVGQRLTGVVRYRGRLLRPDAREITLDGVDLQVLAATVDGRPAELGQTGPEHEASLVKWAEVRTAGRPWITGTEAVEVPTGN